MRDTVKAILIAELFAVATYALGWWTVPLIAAVLGFVSRDENVARYTALCAMAGWATLLLLDAAKGPVANMAARMGGVMGIPAVLLYVLTLLLPALLAWSAARLSAGLFLRRPVS